MGTGRAVQLLCHLNFTQLSVQPRDNCKEEEKAQVHLLPLTSCLKWPLGLPHQQWQLTGCFSSLVPSKAICWRSLSPPGLRERTPQPQAPGPKESPPAALGYCTARGLFSTHDNNGSSSQKPQKLLLPISVPARSMGHFYRGRNQAVQTYHFHWFSATAYFLRVFVLCFPAALVACKPVIPIIFVTLSGAL